MTANKPNQLPRRIAAERLYVDGFTLTEIGEKLKIAMSTLKQWRERFDWDDKCRVHLNPIEVLGVAICRLADKPNKNAGERLELKTLCESLVELQLAQTTITKKMAEAEKILAEAEKIKAEAEIIKETGVSPSARGRDSKGYQKKVKNDISSITPEQLDEVRNRLFFGYQLIWYDNKNQRHRFILKSRQIGATFYFSFEALDDAIRTGDNQIFLSASRAQAEVFKAYIIAFALKEFQIELKGDVIQLSNGAELRFLSTNCQKLR
jgi:uncharacterized protein YjcR